MYRVARNLLIDNVRRHAHDALVKVVRGRPNDDGTNVLAGIAGDLTSLAEQASYRELGGMVDQLLETLPDEQLLTFVLHHYAGLTVSEVADVMESSVPTSKSRLRLAREKLSARLIDRGVVNPAAERS